MIITVIVFIMKNNNKGSNEIVVREHVSQYIHITSSIFNSRKVWKVEFNSGKEVVLYKCGNEWMQRTEDNLEMKVIEAIGKCIDITVTDKT